VLRPEGNVKLYAAPVNGNFDASCYDVFLPYPVKHDINSADEDFPHAVETEEMPENIEVSSLPRCRPSLSLLHVFHVVQLEKEISCEFLEPTDFESELSNV
jgi:hypothetical protein